MRFVADSGLWSTGPTAAPDPLTAVIELAGAVAGLLAASAYGLLAGWSLPTQRSVYMLWALALALRPG